MSFDTPPMFNCPKCKKDISKPNRCHHCGWFWVPELEQTSESSGNFTPDKPSKEPNRDGIDDLIRLQRRTNKNLEQTNEHLQKLLSDFFWFRVAVIGFFIFGGIFATGGFK